MVDIIIVANDPVLRARLWLGGWNIGQFLVSVDKDAVLAAGPIKHHRVMCPNIRDGLRANLWHIKADPSSGRPENPVRRDGHDQVGVGGRRSFLAPKPKSKREIILIIEINGRIGNDQIVIALKIEEQ